MTVWIAVLGVSLGSFALRLVPLLVLGRLGPSARIEALIGRAGLAAATALIALATRSAAHATAPPAVLAAVAAGTVLTVRRASMLCIVTIGGAVYAAVRFGALVS